MLATLSALTTSFAQPSTFRGVPSTLRARWDFADVRMSAEYDPMSNKRQWWRDLREEMREMEERMKECLEDEECALSVAEELEDEFAQELLIRAREVSAALLPASATTMRKPITQTYANLGDYALLLSSQRREEIDEIKEFVNRLQDQRRAAVAMLWDDRTTERLLTEGSKACVP